MFRRQARPSSTLLRGDTAGRGHATAGHKGQSQASPRHSAHQPTAALGTWAEGHCPATWTQKGRRKRLEPAACAQRASRFKISCLDGGGGLLLSRPDPGASWLFTQKAPRLPDSDGVIVCPESALCPETSPFLSTLPERGLQPDRG